MRRTRIALVVGLPCVLLLFALACGGGSSSNNNNNNNNNGGSSASNQVPLSVNAGPSNVSANYNVAFVSVQVCKPGTSTCVTVPYVEVDTGATGIRLLSGTVSGLGLPNTPSGGLTLANCVQYLDLSYQWGPVATADIVLAGETAHNVPIQIIAEPGYDFPTAPSSCSNGGAAVNTVDTLLANGFIGLSFYQQDCGAACVTGPPPLGAYYACSSSSCSPSSAAMTAQLQNPVGMFGSDNNGVILSLPNVPVGGAPTVAGTLTFGIGTQSDNALGSAVVLVPDGSGNFTTKFETATTNVGFIDSGSNGLYFLTSAQTGIPECTASGSAGFYCPTSTDSLSATNSSNGTTSTVSFSVANAESLNGNDSALPGLAGTGSSTNPEFGLYFDWGLPFFYGRSVFVALEGQSAAGTNGPYWAY